MELEHAKLLVDFKLEKKIEHSSPEVAPEVFTALVDAGMIEKTGDFTDKGVKKSKQLETMATTLMRGVDISKRKMESLDINDQRWVTGSYDKNAYATDGAALIVADISKDVSVERGSTVERTRAGIVFKKAAGMKGMRKLTPFLWQKWVFEGYDIVWLKNDNDTIFIPIAGLYYDLMLTKFANPTFYGKLFKDKPAIVQVRIEKGAMKYNRVHGLITPLLLTMDDSLIPTVCRR